METPYFSNNFIKLYLLLPLALKPTVGFGLSNNVLPFFPFWHQLSPSSHSQHLKISFYFLFPSFPASFPSSRPFQVLSEDLFGHPILLHSLQVLTNLSFALLSILLYFLLSSSLLVLDSSIQWAQINRFHSLRIFYFNHKMGKYININILTLTSMPLILILIDFHYFPALYIVSPSQLKISRFILLLVVCLCQEVKIYNLTNMLITLIQCCTKIRKILLILCDRAERPTEGHRYRQWNKRHRDLSQLLYCGFLSY